MTHLHLSPDFLRKKHLDEVNIDQTQGAKSNDKPDNCQKYIYHDNLEVSIQYSESYGVYI